MIGVQKGCDEMFMWKTNNCFVSLIDTSHGISYAVLWGKVILLLAV